MTPTVEAGPDGSVVVHGMALEAVRARLIPRPPGRPPKAVATISAESIRAAVIELAIRDFPCDAVFLADQVGCTRRELRDAIRRHFGSWPEMRRVSGEWDRAAS